MEKLRIEKEILDIQKDSEEGSGWLIIPEENDSYHYTAMIYGCKGTPYEGGTFYLDVQYPKQGYPSKPLAVRFLSKVYHPNVCSTTGKICLSILKD